MGRPRLPVASSVAWPAVAVEQVKGALVYMLRKSECLHLYPVPSTMSASMREALYPSGAKDDPRDADLLLELLVLHRDKALRAASRLSDSSTSPLAGPRSVELLCT